MSPMWKRIAVIAAWVVATFATAAITLAAVGQAGHEVSERPAVPVSAEDLVAAVETTTTTTAVTTTSLDTTGDDPSTTTSTSTPASSSTTAPEAGASSTTVAATTTESRNTPGGTVTVIASGSSLSLASAIPAQGFSADVESASGQEIEVRFEKQDETVEYRIKARLEDGVITWEIRTETDGD